MALTKIKANALDTAQVNLAGTVVTGRVPVTGGGTASTTAANARTALGATVVGAQVFTATDAATVRTTIGSNDAGNINTGVLGVAYGGTGGTTGAGAITALNRNAYTTATNGMTLAAGGVYAATGAISLNMVAYATAVVGDTITILNSGMNWATSNVTITGNANTKFNGVVENLVCDSNSIAGFDLVCVLKDGSFAYWNIV